MTANDYHQRRLQDEMRDPVFATEYARARQELTSNTAPANLEEMARVHDLSFEMLSILESVAKHGNVMDYEISQGLAWRIRRVLKEAHGG